MYIVKRMCSNKHYYLTGGTKSIAHRLTNYLRCRNKPLFAHKHNVKASVVETKLIWDVRTMLAPHLIIDESVVNQTKCSLVVMTTASILTKWLTFLALYAVHQVMLVGS
jgi:hypothetical protein